MGDAYVFDLSSGISDLLLGPYHVTYCLKLDDNEDAVVRFAAGNFSRFPFGRG